MIRALLFKLWLPIGFLMLASGLLAAACWWQIGQYQQHQQAIVRLRMDIQTSQQQLTSAQRDFAALVKIAPALHQYMDAGVIDGVRDPNWAQQLLARAGDFGIHDFASTIGRRQALGEEGAHFAKTLQQIRFSAANEPQALDFIEQIYQLDGLAFLDHCVFDGENGQIAVSCALYWYQILSRDEP